jgi:hypothetical protein
VASDQSIHVVYAGQPLVARQPVWWKVRVWVDVPGPDGSRRADDQPSPWSAPARWSKSWQSSACESQVNGCQLLA